MRLYIDPGTGSMLFSLLIGVVGAAYYFAKVLFIKLRYGLSGGKAEENTEKIPFVIYSDDKRYWSIFEPVCRIFCDKGIKIVYITGSEDDPVFRCGYENITAKFIGKTNKAFAHLNFLNATIVFSTTPGLDVYQWKRSKNVDYYVHIPHAPGDITRYRMLGIDFYDAILLSGEYQIGQVRALEALRELPAKELVKVGIPYMDEMVKRLENAPPVAAHPRTVMLAPSWGKSAIFSVYGTRIIDALIQTGYHLIIRPHPQSFESEAALMETLMQKYPDSENLEWNKDSDNFESLRKADILISDFSGVTFDFALIHNKPVIYTDPNVDLSAYDAWWLEEPLWTFTALERIGRQLKNEDIDHLKEIIDDCLENPRYMQGIDELKQETWEHYGQGAQRTAEYLIQKYKEISGKEITG